MSKLPLILLPPSEGKSVGGSGPAWRPGSMSIDLDEQRSAVLAALGRAMAGSGPARGRLLGVKGDALARATAANLAIVGAPTSRAIDRYTGVLYGELDAAALTGAPRRRLRSSVLIFSGLWGLVAPEDPVPDYKLKMGATLPRLGKLSTWWREPLSTALADRASGRVVWNLLPNEHDAAWAAARVPSREVRSVRFLERRADGSLVAVSHWNKLLKGALVRLLLEEPDAGPDRLADWDHPLGYRLDPSATVRAGGSTVLSFVQRDTD